MTQIREHSVSFAYDQVPVFHTAIELYRLFWFEKPLFLSHQLYISQVSREGEIMYWLSIVFTEILLHCTLRYQQSPNSSILSKYMSADFQHLFPDFQHLFPNTISDRPQNIRQRVRKNPERVFSSSQFTKFTIQLQPFFFYNCSDFKVNATISPQKQNFFT